MHDQSKPVRSRAPNGFRRTASFLAAMLIVTAATLVYSPGTASAHGVTMTPGSRTYLCYLDGLTDTGEIKPTNPACADAVAQSGTTPLYNWFAVLDSAAAGRNVGYVPDGTICSAGDKSPYDFASYNAARADWPITHLTAGNTIQVRHSNWAAHPGEFIMYITKDGWDPLEPLAWADLEPLHSETDPPQSGGPGNIDNYYYWDVALPADKTGQHLIFTQWVRSDSSENFFSCADVVFDGGNGEVTGIEADTDPTTVAGVMADHSHHGSEALPVDGSAHSQSGSAPLWVLLPSLLAILAVGIVVSRKAMARRAAITT